MLKNPWDNDPIVSAPSSRQPILSPETTWRQMTPDETKQRGLNPDASYQISSAGETKPISEGKVPLPLSQKDRSGMVSRYRSLGGLDSVVGELEKLYTDNLKGGKGGIFGMYGERNPRAKLTWAQVADIRASSETQVATAAQYGVSQNLISKIRRGDIAM